MEEKIQAKNRIQIIDAMRGLCVVLMAFHHLFLDLVELCGAPYWLFSNPVFDFLHYVFAGMFFFLAGISSRLSRSNLKRGIKCFLVALVMTVVTSLPMLNMPIRFGVLHCLGFCMIFYGLTAKAWEILPRFIMPVIYIALTVLSALAVKYIPVSNNIAKFIFPFGWTPSGFYSSDYFPIFPWMFVFLLGTWFGWYVKEHKLPQWFYSFKIKFFPAVGRHALIVYVLHQPVFYGLIYAYLFIVSLI